jgi:crotonobetainyl-CoA:carnitine CoA-transferase CaiB-like acyl-CoA transferase
MEDMTLIKLLEGVKILDLTRLLPGGYCTQMLADMGAEVLKIEDLQLGDYIRSMGPLVDGGDSVYFYALNRNKKSMRLNLKESGGQAVFSRLLESYDILIEGFRPGVMEKLNLGYDSLSKINPGLVYCSVTGYGQSGPYRLRAGHDINYISIAGALGLTGSRDGAPVMPGVQVSDIGGGGLMSAVGILAAIVNRQRTGKGQYIDMGMMDGAVSWLTMYLTDYLNTGEKAGRGEMLLNGGQVCYSVYETSDGKFVSLGAIEPKFWKEFCRISGRNDLLKLQFSGSKNDFGAVQQFFSTKTRDEIVEMFSQTDACVEPVLELNEVMGHPHVLQRQLINELTLPGGKKIKTIAHPIKFPGAETEADQLPPTLGQHTVEVLMSLGYNLEQISSMQAKGVVA